MDHLCDHNQVRTGPILKLSITSADVGKATAAKIAV